MNHQDTKAPSPEEPAPARHYDLAHFVREDARIKAADWALDRRVDAQLEQWPVGTLIVIALTDDTDGLNKARHWEIEKRVNRVGDKVWTLRGSTRRDDRNMASWQVLNLLFSANFGGQSFEQRRPGSTFTAIVPGEVPS